MEARISPTSSSCLKIVERLFRDLTKNQLRRGSSANVEELIMAIGDYVDKHNGNPKPFVGTAKATEILESVKRARKALDIGQSDCRTTLETVWRETLEAGVYLARHLQSAALKESP